MILNFQELEITNAELQKFQSYLSLINEKLNAKDKSRFLEIEKQAIIEQINDLKFQIKEYSDLWASNRTLPKISSLFEIPRFLIQSRISQGISQEELANKIELSVLSFQEFENNDYELANLDLIRKIISILNITLPSEIIIPKEDYTFGDFVEKIKKIGFDKNNLYLKILPSKFSSYINNAMNKETINLIGLLAIECICNIIALKPIEFFSSQFTDLPKSKNGLVRYKIRKNANIKYTQAYTFYAHYIALITLQAFPFTTPKILTDPYQIHDEILMKYGELNLTNAIKYLWDCGIPVVSLNDSGTFQGALFKENDKFLIILKSVSKYENRYIFDLFHELYHIIQNSEEKGIQFIELEDYDISDINDPKLLAEEKYANMFSAAVLLRKPSDSIIKMCLDLANNDLKLLKKSVINVAKQQNVPIDILANCVAYKVSQLNNNWWGSAESLQKQSENITQQINAISYQYLNLSLISEADREILIKALDG